MMTQLSDTRPELASFVSRDRCISCHSAKLSRVAGGKFSSPPLSTFISRDPWGVSPMPFIADAAWAYVRCDDCEQTFHRYVLSPEWQHTRFTQWMTEASMRAFEDQLGDPGFAYRFHLAQALTAHVMRLERLTRSLRGASVPRLLDFGCGWGQLLSLARLHSFDAYGVDWDANRRDSSSALSDSIFSNLRELDAASPAPFHAITLIEVLEHLEEPLALLKTLRERLVEGGILVLETPNCQGVTDIRSEDDYRKIHPLDHINGFTPKSLLGIARNAGFAPVAAPTAHVAADFRRVLKVLAKRVVQPLRTKTTQLYLRRVG